VQAAKTPPRKEKQKITEASEMLGRRLYGLLWFPICIVQLGGETFHRFAI
jgi:hypothetical protein